jgi:hypothetical protein
MSAGSCFAANVRRYVEQWGFEYVVTERPHPSWPEAAETGFYDAYSARYGNVYTARQMVQLLQRTAGEFSPREEFWIAPDGSFVDPLRPGLAHRASSLHELRALTGQHLRAVKRAVENATVFVFTLGLTEAWTSADDGVVFPACPGTIAGEYDPERHRFVNFSYEEVSADLDLMIGLLRAISPAIRVVITVSPVPLVATASGQHVLAATAYSKSVLRVAAEEVVRRRTDVAYFPAYEMVLGPHHRESPFEEDLRTVREPVVAEVMCGFRAAYVDAPEDLERPASNGHGHRLAGVVAEALSDDCEEMFADERVWRVERVKEPRSKRRAIDLDTLQLAAGPHTDGSEELCVMEAAAYVAGEDWSDRPSSVSPVAAELLRSLNDAMDDADRQKLKPVIPLLPGSRGAGDLEAVRSWMVMDWHCRKWPSTWLRWAGAVAEADSLEAAGPIAGVETLRAALRALATAREAAALMRLATTHESLEHGLDAAVAAAKADPAEPAIAAARAAISDDVGAFALRAAQREVPVAARWSARRRLRWSEACDAAGYRMAVAAGTAQIAAVRAIASTSAWSAAWNVGASQDVESWHRAAEDARSIGRDAALVLAWRSAWSATSSDEQGAAWAAATGAAAAGLRGPVDELQSAVVELVSSLVDPNLELGESMEAHAAG